MENRYIPHCFPFLSRSHLARAEDSTSDRIDCYYHGRDAFFAAAHCRHFYYHTLKTVLAYDAWLLPYGTCYWHTILGYWYTMWGYYHTILAYWHTILTSSYTSNSWRTGGRGAEKACRVAYSHTMPARKCREIRA